MHSKHCKVVLVAGLAAKSSAIRHGLYANQDQHGGFVLQWKDITSWE